MTSFGSLKGKTMIRAHSTLSLPVNFNNIKNLNNVLEDVDLKKKPSWNASGDRLDTSPKENKDPNTFANRYKDVCHSMHTQPLNMVRVLLSNVSLDLICDRIKLDDMLAILRTIREDRSLHYISLKSKLKGFVVQEDVNTEKKARSADKVLYTRFIINKISDCLSECLKHSCNLKALNLQSIPFGGSAIEILCEGLKSAKFLQHLSLSQCHIDDQACLYLSRALRNVPTLLTLDLSFGKITSNGARHIANLVKAQEIARFDQSWKQSLRYREVNNYEMKGLRRVTLNDNPDICDEGFKWIIDVLMDDFWIRALDMQNCGLTDIGGSLALEMVKSNTEIGVVDIRRNPLIDNNIVISIVRTLSENMTPDKGEYGWLCLPKTTKTISRSGSNFTVNTFRNTSPWNSGPGKLQSKKLIQKPRTTNETRSASIMKVREWNQARNIESFRNNLLEIQNCNNETSDEKCMELNLSSTSSDYPSPSSTEQLDENSESQTDNFEMDKKVPKEGFKELFCDFLKSSIYDEESDSDSQYSS